MPIYEYMCLDCGERFEAMRAMNDADEPIDCQGCESIHTSRLISMFFAQSDGRTLVGNSNACASCHSSSCATCGN